MALAKLTEASTTEELNEYVEQVVEEVAAERAGTEPKSDAQITSEHANNEHKPEKAKEIPAEEKSSSKTAKAEAKAESGDEESSPEWMDEDLKAEVAAYGIEEDELSDFTSREELERAMRLFDKSALAAGRNALAEEDSGRNSKGQFVKKAEPKAKEAEEKPAATEGKYEPKLDRAIYDDGIVDEFTRMRDHYESRLEALESRLLESDARSEESHFDSLVDSLDHADLFGKTDKEDAKQLQRRQDLMIAVKAHRIGMEKLGRPAELNQSLVSRVARMVFAEDLGKKDLKNRTRKISRQANSRLGGGATRPQDPREDPRDEFDRRYKELVGSS